jgi:hypothetical protein
MMRLKILIISLLVLYIVINSAQAGGYIDNRIGNWFLNNYSGEFIYSNFIGRGSASGVSPAALLTFNGSAQIGELIPTITDLEFNLSTENNYYSRMASNLYFESGNEGQASPNGTLYVDTFLLMPKEFDSFHSEIINISEDGKKAEVALYFTYDNVDYQFTNETELIDGENTLMIILQPFCKEFEGLDLYDDVNTLGSSESVDGLDYSGYLTIQGKKG